MGVATRMIIAAAALGFSTAACSGGSSSSVGPRPTLTLPATTPHATILVDQQQGTFSDLTPDQKRRVREIIEADPTVAEIVDGSTMFIEGVGPYTDGTDPETGKDLLVGAIATVKLSRPVTHERIDVPTSARRPYRAQWPDDLQARYSHFMVRFSPFRVENISDFEVRVDLNDEQVVDIYFSPTGDEIAEYIGDQLPSIDYESDAEKVKSVAEGDASIGAILDAIDSEFTSAGTYKLGDHTFGYYSIRAELGGELEGDWPIILDQDITTGDYRSETIHIVEDFAREVSVTVDMDIEKVIGITTSEGD